MKREDVKQKLDALSVPESFYSLSGGLASDGIVLEQVASGWIVYDQERAVRSNVRSFDSEDDACEWFYQRMMSMLSTMAQWSYLKK